MNYKVPSNGSYTVSALCPNCSSVMTAQINAPDTSYVKYIETKNASMREALEKIAHRSPTFSRNGLEWARKDLQAIARDALEGKE